MTWQRRHRDGIGSRGDRPADFALWIEHTVCELGCAASPQGMVAAIQLVNPSNPDPGRNEAVNQNSGPSESTESLGESRPGARSVISN